MLNSYIYIWVQILGGWVFEVDVTRGSVGKSSRMGTYLHQGRHESIASTGSSVTAISIRFNLDFGCVGFIGRLRIHFRVCRLEIVPLNNPSHLDFCPRPISSIPQRKKLCAKPVTLGTDMQDTPHTTSGDPSP